MSDIVYNDNLVLIGGKSATGKSASLMFMDNPEGVWYANCEAGKKLPFRAKFAKQFVITDPMHIYDMFTAAETKPDIHTIVIDTLTFLMEMFESQYVIGSVNTMKAWGDYAQFLKNLMQVHVAKSTKNVVFLSHTSDTVNETEMVMETKVPIKGSSKGVGVEAYFSLVVASKKVSLKTLKDYSNKLLVITPEEEALGFKYVFQTKLTKDTVNERIRGPLGMFSTQETYIDNNIQHLITRLREYYA